MTTRKLLTGALVLAVVVTACAYTATSNADQESVGFDATAAQAGSTLDGQCPHSQADCPMSSGACDAMQKQCKMKTSSCDLTPEQCEAKQAECKAAQAKPCCKGSGDTDV